MVAGEVRILPALQVVISTYLEHMTKQQEIAALRAFAESLPENTYLRPWLLDVLPIVERDINSDLFPSPYTPSDWKREWMEAAGHQAQHIIDKANTSAYIINQDANMMRDKAAWHREATVRELRAALKAMGAE
jgi:hypothetical protein